ncbi:MAG: InlB B-repeat-containing protein [Bacteroidales bacterium]
MDLAEEKVFADGNDEAEIVVVLLDEFDNPVPGETVSFTVSPTFAEFDNDTPTTDEEGRAIARLTATDTGTVTVEASIGGDTKGDTIGSVSVTFVDENITVDADPFEIIADGTSTSLITVAVEDLDNESVAGVSVTVTTDKGSWNGGSQEEIVSTDDTGTATLTLTSSTDAGTATILADHAETTADEVQVEFLPGEADTFVVSVDDIFRSEEATVEVMDAVDSEDNLLSGTYTGTVTIENDEETYENATVTFNFTSGESQYTTDGLTDIPGTYSVSVVIDGVDANTTFEIEQPELRFAFNDQPADPGDSFLYSSEDNIVMSLEEVIKGSHPFEIDVEIKSAVYTDVFSVTVSENEDIFNETLAGGTYTVVVTSITDDDGFSVLNPEESYVYHVDVGYTLGFEIEDEAGDPIEHAEVELDDVGVSTDTWVFEKLVPDTYTYTVSAEGYNPVNGNTEVTGNMTETVTLGLKTYTITATSGNNGEIDPDGDVVITHGDDITFTITPDTNYSFDELVVDGGPVEPTTLTPTITYTFENVTSDDHTIHASFDLNEYTILAESEGGGQIDPAGTVTVTHGDNQNFEFEPDTGHFIDDVLVDEISIGTPSSYLFTNVTKDHGITAKFGIHTYTITAESGDNGSINPVEDVVDYGGTVTFTLSPDEGYEVNEIVVGGVTQTFEGETFILEDIQEDQHVYVSFTKKTFEITVTSGANGTIIPEGEDGIVIVEYGDNQTFDIVPDEGYHTTELIIDDETIPPQNRYTFTNVQEDGSIEATFEINEYLLTYIAGDNGSINDVGIITQTVKHGEDGPEVEANPDDDYQFVQWSDGVTDNPRTDTDVQGPLEVTAIFAEIGEYSIMANVEPVGAGTVSGTGSYTPGDQVSLTASPNPGYEFVEWTGDIQYLDDEDSADATVTMPSDNVSLTANFALFTYDINATVVPDESGTVTGTGTYNHFETVILEATPAEGYHFTGWYENDDMLSANSIYIFEAEEDREDIEAHFAKNQYEIQAQAMPSAGGTVTGTGTYEHGETVILDATPEPGYSFVEWTEEGDPIANATETYTFIAEADRSLTAHFELKQIEITAEAEPAIGGTVTGTGSFSFGEEVTLEASPEEGYAFKEWTVNGNQLSTDMVYTFIAEEDLHVTAHFELKTYTISVDIDPVEGGSVSLDDGSFDDGIFDLLHGESLTFFAIPESSYTFVGWYEVTDEDEEFITESPLYKHTASGDDAGDKHFIARFSEDDYNITADASPVEGGTVTGTGTYGHGADVTLEALPSTGYHFKYWTEGGVIIQTEGNDYTFTATQDRHLTAHFELNDYEIAADLEPEEGGTVSGTGTYTHGDQVTLEVEVNEGYDFAGWFEGEELLSEDETYTFTAEENRTLTAKFDIHTHTINGEPVPFAGGTIEGTGTYDYGTEVTMTATPNTGYHFLYWTHQGEVVSEDEEYVFTITESKYLLAHFALNIYTIDAVANPEDGGEIVGAGNYTHGEEVTLEAVPNTGFYFVNWMENGEEIIADDNGSVTETYTFTAESDRDLTAHFDIFTYDINASADPVAGGTVSGSGTYDHGEEVTMEANPETGYQFVEWTIDGVQVSTDMTYAFTAEEDVDLTAHFELKTYTISAIADPEDGGTVTGTGTYQHGETVTLEALPATGYEFVEWTANGEWTHSDSEYTFTAEQDRDLTAHFQLKVYAIDAAADPADGGTVTGAGDYAHGQEVTLTAAPEEGYYFVEWTEDDAHVSDDEIYTFDAEEDRSLTAHFEKFEYVITATADPLEAGTISGTGTYEHGEEVTLTATSESAYQFIDWTEDDTVVGTDSVISFIAADNRDLVANFEVNIYTIQATSSQGGSINPEGDIEVVHGDNQNFTFEADAGYHLEDILVDGNSVGDESFYLFLNVTSNHTIHAVFALNTYTLTYGTDGNGTLTGDTEQQVDHGGNGSPVTAVPNDGYHFTEWSDGVTDNPRTDMDVTGDIDVIAFFDINTYTLEYDTDGNGSISGEATQTVGHGDDGTPVEAVADEGYHFVEWSDGVTDNPRTDTDVTGDLSVTALFALNTYTITSSAGENGTISPLGETAVTHGDDQSYSIIPDTGYEVQELLVDGDPVDAVEDYTFENVTDDHTIHAEFQLTSYTITATSSEGGSIDPEGEVEVTHGTNQQFQFIPDTGYHIDDVTIDGTSIGDESAYTFQNVTNNHTIHAAFAINVYTLQYEAGDNGSIIGDTEQTVEHGNDAAPVEAIPDEGYHFVEWSDGVTENPRIDTDVTGNIAVTAEFAMSTYMLTFHVVNEDGNEIMDATITLDDEVFGAGQYQFDDMPAGEYDYVVSRGGYFDSEGSVEITDEDVTEEVVLVRDDTSLPDIEHIEVEAYPNPANEHLIITSDINMEAIRMVDVLGKIVYDVAVNDDHHEINVSGFKPGLYFVQVSAAGGTRTIRVQVNTN